RNYQKVPNSLTKQAIPAGLFKGKAKQLYDVLYSMTRGAVVPVRVIRVRKGELMKKANIGSRITFDSNITHLQLVGLIRETVFAGEHAGNEFEVFTFEEMETMPSQSSQSSDSSQTSPSQKQVRVVSLESSQTSQSLNPSEITSYEKPKTLFKTFLKIDDEAPIANAFLKLNEAARATTGKDLTQKDWEAFSEIIELIINETSVARTRAKSVSVYLKFAAENLRRRLYSKTVRYDKNPKMFEPGSVEVAQTEFIAEPLGENRELILENLRKIVEAGGRESIEVFAGNYLPEDWNWLVTNL
ncbi:MAG TPA: hypothetical protein VNB22_22805, partial [Pyrinomonadaceae bacterium]|nr:hypothetical protein [Pyrinomonadaceae bacterium]